MNMWPHFFFLQHAGVRLSMQYNQMLIDYRDIDDDNQEFYDDIASFEKNGNYCSLFIIPLLFFYYVLSN